MSKVWSREKWKSYRGQLDYQTGMTRVLIFREIDLFLNFKKKLVKCMYQFFFRSDHNILGTKTDDHPRLLLPIQAKVIKAIRLLITKSVCLETRNLPAQLRAVMKEWWPPDFRKCYVDLAWIPQDHIIKLTNPIRILTEKCEIYIPTILRYLPICMYLVQQVLA